jgi:hypothetical protein
MQNPSSLSTTEVPATPAKPKDTEALEVPGIEKKDAPLKILIGQFYGCDFDCPVLLKPLQISIFSMVYH